MPQDPPRFRILHHFLEATLVLAEAWPGRTPHDVVAGAIHYMAQAVGLRVVVFPLDVPEQALSNGLDAPF